MTELSLVQRDDSEIKNSGHSYGGPRFNPRYPRDGSQPCVTPVLGYLMSSPGSQASCVCGTQTNIQANTHTHELKIRSQKNKAKYQVSLTPEHHRFLCPLRHMFKVEGSEEGWGQRCSINGRQSFCTSRFLSLSRLFITSLRIDSSPCPGFMGLTVQLSHSVASPWG